jgi:hypothetical protein
MYQNLRFYLSEIDWTPYVMVTVYSLFLCLGSYVMLEMCHMS